MNVLERIDDPFIHKKVNGVFKQKRCFFEKNDKEIFIYLYRVLIWLFFLLILGLDVSISMFKVFIPVAAVGLLLGEIINMAFNHRRTDMS